MNPNQKNSGRRSCHNVITEALGPSAQVHRSIINESVRSAWDLFIDESMLRHIQRCTKEETRRVLQTNNWCVSLHELDAFLAIIYAHGAHKATKIKIHELWNRLWGIPIISETMARNRFIEMMKFLRFDYKQTRSHRPATDKLALISTIWNTFVLSIIDRVPTLPWMSNVFLPQLNADLPSTCQISPENSASNFGWPLI